MTRTTAKWVGYVAAPFAAICWYIFATTFSDAMWTFAGDPTDTGSGKAVGLWLGAAVILTVLAAAGLVVASLARAMEELSGYGPTQ